MYPYSETDQQIHFWAQTIARFNRTYVPQKSDDSHTNLAFDPVGKRLMGRWASSPKGDRLMTLNLLTFSFEILDRSLRVIRSFDIEGKIQAELEEEIFAQLAELGFDPEGFAAPMHYEIPDYGFAKQAFSPPERSSLETWAEYRTLANEAALAMLTHLQVEDEIRIWPHHFDTGIYVEPTDQVGIGFGLAMEDGMAGEPYFYASAYGLNGHKVDYEELMPLCVGNWIREENWKGAVLKLSEASQATTTGFIREVVMRYLG